MNVGLLPPPRIRNGAPGPTPNSAGLWAQQYWQWRLRVRWAAASSAVVIVAAAQSIAMHSWIPLWIALLGLGLAVAVGFADRPAREIFRHAIALEASLMLGRRGSPGEAVISLERQSACRRLTRSKLTAGLFLARAYARRWCEQHRSKIQLTAALQQLAGG